MVSAGFVSFSALVAVTGAIFALVDRTQPDPYMDEIFHVPQAQKYCQGRFTEWDPKITTLPGLYFISIGILTPLRQVAPFLNFSSSRFGSPDASSDESFASDISTVLCSTACLRAVNLLMSMVTVLIIHKLNTQIHEGKHYFDEGKVLLSSVNLGIFPLFYFFTFFYYTDVGSTFLVLFMYCLHLEGRDWLASFIGVLAVSFRQTNIVWVAFVALQAVGPVLIHTIHARMLDTVKPVQFSLTTMGQLQELVEGTYLLFLAPRRLLRFVLDSLHISGGYIMVWMLFVAFLTWNEGIVVGDRAAHIAVFHPTQVLYFCLFALAFSAPFCVTKWKSFLLVCRKHYLVAFAAAVVAYGIVSGHTLAHPYLLADNRHYPFYFWRKVVARTEWSKFALVPAYLYGGFCVLSSLRKANIIFKLSFPVFVVVSLSPQFLLEFRYFIIPFLLYRLQVRPLAWWKLLCETALFTLINAFTIGMFVLRPFRWEHEPTEVQRFMW